MQEAELMVMAPFESASELQEAHTSLLEALDRQIGPETTADNATAALTQHNIAEIITQSRLALQHLLRLFRLRRKPKLNATAYQRLARMIALTWQALIPVLDSQK